MRTVCVLLCWFVVGAQTTFGQEQSAARRVEFSFRPIAEGLRAGDRYVVISSPIQTTLIDSESAASWEEKLAEVPIIAIGRVVIKRAAFLNLRNFRTFTLVDADRANWIGSSITVQIEEVLKNGSSMSLAPEQRVTFVDEGDGSGMINGVHVDTRTEWLRPVELGRRYLLTAEVKDRFIVTGMWDEPDSRGRMQGRFRDGHEAFDKVQPFSEWNIDEAAHRLRQEIIRQREPQ